MKTEFSFSYFEEKFEVPPWVHLIKVSPKVHNIDWLSDIVQRQVTKPVVLILSAYEAPQLEFYQRILEASKKNDLIKEMVVIDGGIDDIPGYKKLDFSFGFFQDFLVQMNHIPLKRRKYLFSMCARWPRLQRVLLMKMLLQYNLHQKGLISFGVTNKHDNFNRQSTPDKLMNLFTEEERKHFPFVIDREIVEERNTEGWNITEWHKNPIYTKVNDSVFSLVCETSFETTKSKTVPEFYFNNQFCHNRRFITEKTMMSIYNRQIPILLTLPNTVSYLRDLGFDMFDDIVDHSYDNEPDPDKRVHLVGMEMVRLRGLAIPKTFSSMHDRRVKENIKLGRKIYKEKKQRFLKELNTLFDSSPYLL